MRRITLALVLVLCGASPAFALQTPPPAVPAAPPVSPVRPAPTPGQVTTRPTAAPTVPSAVVAPQAPTPPTPPAAPQAPRMEAPSTWQNIKLDVTITDSITGDAQSKKTVTMLIVDSRSGMVRSMSERGVINIDARPSIRPDGRIYLQITVEYRPQLNFEQTKQMAATSSITSFNEALSLVVADGKPVLASQSADPSGDRKVTLEITATVVK